MSTISPVTNIDPARCGAGRLLSSKNGGLFWGWYQSKRWTPSTVSLLILGSQPLFGYSNLREIPMCPEKSRRILPTLARAHYRGSPVCASPSTLPSARCRPRRWWRCGFSGDLPWDNQEELGFWRHQLIHVVSYIYICNYIYTHVLCIFPAFLDKWNCQIIR